MADRAPAFARDSATHDYYEQRANEYDHWYEGTGLFADRDRPGWADERERVVDLLSRLPAATTLDVACGTAYLSRHLAGFVVGVDQSVGMLGVARERLRSGCVVRGDGTRLPVCRGAFDRVFTGHFYGHLGETERAAFLEVARAAAPELIVVDTPLRDGVEPAQWQERNC